MSVFTPLGDSSTVSISQSSQTFALPNLASEAPAIRLVSRQGNQEGWWVKLGDNAVTVSQSDGMKVFPGTHVDPLVLEVNNGETHIAIMCDGPPGEMTITGGGLYAGHDFGPIGASSVIAVTQSDQGMALPALPVDNPVLALTEGGANMEALYLKFGDSMVSGDRDTSMKCMPGPIGSPAFVGVPSGATHVSLFCDGVPGNLRLTPGAWRSGTIAVDRINADTISANTYIGIPAGVEAADQAEQEAGVITDKYTSPGTQQYHLSAAKAWVNFSGMNGAIRSDYNVSSVSDNGTGDYTVNWDTDFSADEQFAYLGATNDANNYISFPNDGPSSTEVQSRNNGEVPQDSDTVFVAAFGDQ